MNVKVEITKYGNRFRVSMSDLPFKIISIGDRVDYAIDSFNIKVKELSKELKRQGDSAASSYHTIRKDLSNKNLIFHFDPIAWDDYLNIGPSKQQLEDCTLLISIDLSDTEMGRDYAKKRAEKLKSRQNIIVKEKDHARSDRFKALFFDGHEKLSGDILVPDLKKADRNSPFYHRTVVFTGILESISRGEAANIVKSMGADINTSISSLTHYVIVGADAGPAKLKKIENYNAKGANIRIIYEPEFLEMIK